MICNDCSTGLKPGEASCYRCGWKVPPKLTPETTAVVRVEPVIHERTEKSDESLALMRRICSGHTPPHPRAWMLNPKSARAAQMAAEVNRHTMSLEPLEREPGADDA